MQASNANVFVIRDESATEIAGGFKLADQAIQKANTGRIISVGSEVTDKTMEVGRIAIFTKQVGQDLDIGGQVIVVLRQDQVFGYADNRE